jgi:hypothetical protein
MGTATATKEVPSPVTRKIKLVMPVRKKTAQAKAKNDNVNLTEIQKMYILYTQAWHPKKEPKGDKAVEALCETQLETRDMLANLKPTCLQDAICQLEALLDGVCEEAHTTPDKFLQQDNIGKGNINDIKLTLSVLNYLKSLPVTVKPKSATISDPLVQLWKEMEEAEKKACAYGDIYEEAWNRLLPREGKIELNMPLAEEERTQIKAIQDKVGFTPYYDKHEALWDRYFQIRNKIVGTPAISLEGVAVHIKYFGSDTWTDEYQDKLTQMIVGELQNIQHAANGG